MQQHPYIFGKSKMDLRHDLTYITYGYLWTYFKYFMKFDLGYALLGEIIFTIKLLSLSANFSGDEHLMLAKH